MTLMVTIRNTETGDEQTRELPDNDYIVIATATDSTAATTRQVPVTKAICHEGPDFPDTGNGACCYGAAIYGPHRAVSNPEEAVNQGGSRRHLSIDLSPIGHGRGGTALCHTEAAPVRVHDQEAADWERDILLGLDPRDISVLPLCKRCESKAPKGSDR